MSYILEAIKKAESERGNTRLYENGYVNKPQQEVKRIPWLAIAIFVNAAILLAWIGVQQFSDSNHRQDKSKSNSVKDHAQLSNELMLPPAEKKLIEKQSQTVGVTNNKTVGVINNNLAHSKNAPELDQASNEADNKPRFISQPVIAEIQKDKIILPEKVINIREKIVPAKVESLPFVGNSLIDGDNNESLNNHNKLMSPRALDAADDVTHERVVPVVENLNVPSLNELPYALQQRIPDLAISVHIYNVAKSARKVRVNGKLLLQGEAIDDALSVQEITSYGVIFNYEGELFKVSLR